jgi:hypothetical protein
MSLPAQLVADTLLSMDLAPSFFEALFDPLRPKDAVAYSSTCSDLKKWLSERRCDLQTDFRLVRGLAMTLRLLKAMAGPYRGVKGLRSTHMIAWDLAGYHHLTAERDVRLLGMLSNRLSKLRHLVLHAFDSGTFGRSSCSRTPNPSPPKPNLAHLTLSSWTDELYSRTRRAAQS